MSIIENVNQFGDDALHAAVCVVGSGPAGAVVAVALASAGVDVLVLEAGSTQPSHDLASTLGRLNVDGEADVRFGASRQLGGATNLWSGRLAPLEPIDLERRDWVPYSGWPLSWGELERYYARAAEVLGIPGHRHFAEGDSPGLATGMEAKVFQWAKHAFSAREYLTNAARANDRLRVVLDAPVRRLIEGANARVVEAAEVGLAGGRTATVRARVFVVAAGGIESARLLLNSTSVRPHGIGNDRDVVGRYFSTHPKANMASLLGSERVSTRHPLFSDWPVADGIVRHGLGFDAATQREHRLLNHYVQLLPLFEHTANRLFESIKGSRTIQSPLVDRAPLIRGVLPGLGLLVFDAMGRLGGVQRRAKTFVLRGFLDQYPNPDNRVTLSDQMDATGMPKADIAWTYSGADRASVVAFFAAMDRAARAHARARVEYEPLKTSSHWPLTALHSHFMGTTRMGDDPASSVTDAHGRVHGSENLFVAGPSLFPTYGYANPVYTIVALSLRLADHMKEKLV
ncbi:MAG TPA: FAD-dependent oxidoreductase [Candidatus Krumholzibacteria bacterium]|nr:FAD-dependent oxidoreductase [Candidatus Krumholzibacteria bacterium]